MPQNRSQQPPAMPLRYALSLSSTGLLRASQPLYLHNTGNASRIYQMILLLGLTSKEMQICLSRLLPYIRYREIGLVLSKPGRLGRSKERIGQAEVFHPTSPFLGRSAGTAYAGKQASFPLSSLARIQAKCVGGQLQRCFPCFGSLESLLDKRDTYVLFSEVSGRTPSNITMFTCFMPREEGISS